MTLSGPVKLRDATVEEVLAATHEVADRARIKPHKLAWVSARGPWVLASVPITMLNYQGLDDAGPERVERALQYRDLPESSMPPGLADYGFRARAHRRLKAYVFDGNHRVLAAQLAGRGAVRMWMPLDGFLALQQDAVLERQDNPIAAPPPSTVTATVTFSEGDDGHVFARVASDDELARSTIMLSLREFWRVDAEDYEGSNQAKWQRRLRR